MSSNAPILLHGDCLDHLRSLEDESADLVYLDPPFLTNKNHSSVTRDRSKTFSFADIWEGFDDYAQFMGERLVEVHRVLRKTGSVFVHCDTSANFLLRALLDKIFGAKQFQSEIVWTYRRWSNSAKGLMPSHQTVLFYARTEQYKFNRIYTDYSETTNVDQILQLRARDEHGVSTYATDDDGNVVFGSERKKGVPLSDVWEIPYLNPKAKERTGYPTQKPMLLLEKIIELVTEPGDLVVDPFCGSGTTLVAAMLLGRKSIGIDSSIEAVEIARQRIAVPVRTESALMKKGRAAYVSADIDALGILKGLDLIPVHRNSGIDAFCRPTNSATLVPIRVQRNGESIARAAELLSKAARSKMAETAILVKTQNMDDLFALSLPAFVKLVDATAFQIQRLLDDHLDNPGAPTATTKSLVDDTHERSTGASLHAINVAPRS